MTLSDLIPACSPFLTRVADNFSPLGRHLYHYSHFALASAVPLAVVAEDGSGLQVRRTRGAKGSDAWERGLFPCMHAPLSTTTTPPPLLLPPSHIPAACCRHRNGDCHPMALPRIPQLGGVRLRPQGGPPRPAGRSPGPDGCRRAGNDAVGARGARFDLYG